MLLLKVLKGRDKALIRILAFRGDIGILRYP